jgi:hypothetical protein
MNFAIDPGANGCVATRNQPFKMPETALDLADLIRQLYACGYRTCYLEEIPKHGGKNASAMIKLARQYGEVRGVLATVGLRVVEIRPQDWQRAVGVVAGGDAGKRKRAIKERAQQLYPGVEVTLWNADALMILEAGERLYGPSRKVLE